MKSNHKDVTDPARFLTARQLAARWSISLPHAYRLIGSTLPAIRIGAAVRVPVEAIQQYEHLQLGGRTGGVS